MKEHPILFSTEMVQAILAGNKTQTRRVVKKFPLDLDWFTSGLKEDFVRETLNIHCPFGKVGDILWVRETWTIFLDAYLFKSTNAIFKGVKWRPSIFMPKDIAQVWLEITDIRIERLNDISEDDAKCEGVLIGRTAIDDYCWKDYSIDLFVFDFAKTSFKTLWDSINGKPTSKNPNPPSWESNPWVWAITFKVLSTTGNRLFGEELIIHNQLD